MIKIEIKVKNHEHFKSSTSKYFIIQVKYHQTHKHNLLKV